MFWCEGWCSSSRQGASFQRRSDCQHCQPDLSPLLPETWCLKTARGRLSPGSGRDCSVEVGADYEQSAGCNWKRSYQKHEFDGQKLCHGHSLTYGICRASDFVGHDVSLSTIHEQVGPGQKLTVGLWDLHFHLLDSSFNFVPLSFLVSMSRWLMILHTAGFRRSSWAVLWLHEHSELLGTDTVKKHGLRNVEWRIDKAWLACPLPTRVVTQLHQAMDLSNLHSVGILCCHAIFMMILWNQSQHEFTEMQIIWICLNPFTQPARSFWD